MDVKHNHISIAYDKYDAVFALPLAVEQLAEFLGEFVALWQILVAIPAQKHVSDQRRNALVSSGKSGDSVLTQTSNPAQKHVFRCE